MPICYGGGIKSTDEIHYLIKIGFEKVLISNAAIVNPKLISDAVSIFGSQVIVVCFDLRRCVETGRYHVFTHNGRHKRNLNLKTLMANCIENGAGEVLINSIDADGTYDGLNTDMLNHLNEKIPVPLTLLGGASSNEEIQTLMKERDINIAAGFFVDFS